MINIDTPIFPSMKGQDWHHVNCFGCGPGNQFSLRADFTFDEKSGEVNFEYIIHKGYEGAPGYSHGGILATLLDEAQGCLCFHIGHVVMTEKLYINYKKAVPLEKPIWIRAWLSAVRKRRLYTKGMIYIANGDDFDVYVTSSASWYILPERIQKRMFQHSNNDKIFQKQHQLLELNRKRAREIRLRLRKSKKE